MTRNRSQKHPTPASLTARLQGLFVALIMLLNLAPALGAVPGPVSIGAGGCTLERAASDCCCDLPAEPVGCCTPVEGCGCTTRRAPSPAEDGLLPDAVLAPAVGTADRLGLLRGTVARLAFLATLLC